jgi:1,4-dihydroxy-2-naphthoate octaprenyltransferase
MPTDVIELVARGTERAAAIAWSPEDVVAGVERRALVSDAGRLSCPSRLSRHVVRRNVAVQDGEPIVVRWVDFASLRRERPAWPLLAMIAVRWETLIGSLFPVALGLVCASRVRPLHAIAMIAATLSIHASVNLLSEAFEHVRGDDSLHRWGGSKVLQRGWLTAKQLVRWGAALGVIGAAVGIAVVVATASLPLLGFGALGALVAWQFKLPPLRLDRTLVGEWLLLVVFGPIVAAAACFAASGELRIDAAIAGAIASAALGLRRHLRNTRRLPDDTMLGNRTLSTRLGFGMGRALTMLLALALSTLPSIFVVAGIAPTWELASLAIAPLLVWSLRPALVAFAPHDPRVTTSIRRTDVALAVYALAVVLLWAT